MVQAIVDDMIPCSAPRNSVVLEGILLVADVYDATVRVDAAIFVKVILIVWLLHEIMSRYSVLSTG